MNPKSHTAVGIDGCRGGWIAAVHQADGSIDCWDIRTNYCDVIRLRS